MRTAPLASLLTLVMIAPRTLAAWGLPDPINSRMEIISDIYTQVLFVGVLVFLFVFAWLLYSLVKFRPGGDGQATNEKHRGSIKAELVWTIIPLLIVGWVGVISFQGLSELQAVEENPAAEIQVDGFQWFWQFDYGDGVVLSQNPAANGSLATQDPFLIPANEPVTFNITSQDVIHSFYLPELGVKMDAVPGANNFATVTAPEGEYLVQCAEMCGLQHAYMNAKIKAVPMDEYEDWIQEKRQAAQQADIQQDLNVTLTQDGFDPASLTGVAGVKLNFHITNEDASSRSFSIQGTNVSATVDAGTTTTLNTTLQAGEYTMESEGDSATLTVDEPETLSVELDEWSVTGSQTTLETGTPYLIEVSNVGQVPHNLYIGIPEETGETQDIYWQTALIQAGASETLLVVPSNEHTGAQEWWCDVSGHYSQGMTEPITIQ